MQIMKASEFKAKCLHVMDEINRTGEEITITKNGETCFCPEGVSRRTGNTFRPA